MKGRLSLALCVPLLATPAAADWEDVSAIFKERCTKCHEGDYAPLGLSLTSHAAVMSGSWTGPVVFPDTPEESPLYGRITGTLQPRMPLDGPPFLDDTEIATLRAWIEAGAPGPAADAPVPVEAAPPDPYADGIITFPEVERIFLTRCIECHSDNSKEGGPPEDLRLTSYAETLAGGERLAVVPGNPQASEIIRRVEGRADPRMPFDGPPWLTPEQIMLLRDWIAGGAMDAEGNPAPVPVGAQVRYRGTMTGPNEIDGIPFTITGATRIDDRPGVGQQAEVRGAVAADGSIVATRWRDR
jgi:mono/diheme cytochrome c family protein